MSCGPPTTRTRYWEWNVETHDEMTVGGMDGHSEEDGGRDLVSKEWSGARRYSAHQRDRLYTARVLSSSLSSLDGRFTGIDALHD